MRRVFGIDVFMEYWLYGEIRRKGLSKKLRRIENFRIEEYLILLFLWDIGYREIRREGLSKKLKRFENSKELKSS